MRSLADLHPEQKACIAWMLERKTGCITPECGSGKTIMCLTLYTEVCKNCPDHEPKMLVVSTPTGIKETWSTEHKNWAYTQDLKVVPLVGDCSGRVKILCAERNFGQIFLVSYQNLEWLAASSLCPNFDIVIADEGSCLKGHASKWRDALVACAPDATWRIISTATPAPHDAMDYWGLCKYLDNGACLDSPNITTFRALYCKQIPLGNKPGSRYELRNKEAVAEIERRVAPLFYSFSLNKETPIETITVEAEFSPEAMAIYKRVEKDQCLGSVKVMATGQIIWDDSLDAMALTNKLAQIANGFVYCDEALRLSDKCLEELNAEELVKASKRKRTVIDLFPDRINIFKKMIAGIRKRHPDSNIAVTYLFKHDLELLKTAFPEGVGDDEGNIVDRWNKGEIPILFLQYARSSKSLNLQSGGYVMAVYSATWNWEHDYQIARRLARQGQKAEKVYVYKLHVKGTVDDNKIATLGKRSMNHRSFQKKIVQKLRERQS